MARNTTITTLCGSLSLHPVATGAVMHRAGYEALGLDYAYVPFRVDEQTLGGALEAARVLSIRGLGVSMPFKEQVIPLLDQVAPLAARIGAVNTIVNDGGVLTGHNTDALGAVRALEEVGEVRGQRVLLLGAGGAAKAIGHGLVEAGATVRVLNRTGARAEALADALSTRTTGTVTGGRLDELTGLDGVDILVNATSAGMKEYGGDPPIDEAWLRDGLTVLDIVYKPVRTRLYRAAKERGAVAVHGGRMLLHQAAAQFQLYTGQEAPLRAMNAALATAIG